MTVDMNALATENPAAHAYILQLRGEAGEHRVKANEANAARQVAEAEAARYKTDLEAVTAKVTAFEEAGSKATEADWKKAAATKHGLSETQAGYVTGKTEAEIQASAAKVAADFGVKAPAPSGPATKPPADPVLGNPDNGAGGDPAGPDPENEEFVRKLRQARGLSDSETA